MKDVEALRSFCLELSSDEPSPGGGTASAAAGAMSASLLVMVCGMTGRSRRHMEHWPEVGDLRTALERRRDALLSLASEDARAYDALFEASKRQRANDTAENREKLQASLIRAAEVPLKTAAECLGLLGQSVIVAGLQVRSASSDSVVAVFLAEAGFKGASANVKINLKDIKDMDFIRRTEEGLRDWSKKAEALVEDALARLRDLA